MSIYAPFRFLIAAAGALLVATVIASSSAHALLLGDAVAQSAFGMPLRAVIPVRPAPGESLESGCFQLVPTAGRTGAPIVTGRVSLERAAATPRLIVTTPNAINDPAVQFAIQAGCDGITRRNYVLLLDPSAANAATAVQPITAREPGQERPNATLSTARRSADSSPVGEPRAAPRAVRADRASGAVAAAGPAGGESATAATRPAPLRQTAAPSQATKPAPTPSRAQQVETEDQDNLWWYLAAPLVVVGAIAFGSSVVRRRRAALEVPHWTHGAAYTGPRSFTDLSAAPVTLSHLDAPRLPSISSGTKPRSVTPSQHPELTETRSRSRGTPDADVSMLDTLINATEEDMVEERAVREAWAAARSDVENEANGNAILRAIEAAERDLLFTPPPPAQAAMDRSLDDDLLSRPRRPDKAAA